MLSRIFSSTKSSLAIHTQSNVPTSLTMPSVTRLDCIICSLQENISKLVGDNAKGLHFWNCTTNDSFAACQLTLHSCSFDSLVCFYVSSELPLQSFDMRSHPLAISFKFGTINEQGRCWNRVVIFMEIRHGD